MLVIIDSDITTWLTDGIYPAVSQYFIIHGLTGQCTSTHRLVFVSRCQKSTGSGEQSRIQGQTLAQGLWEVSQRPCTRVCPWILNKKFLEAVLQWCCQRLKVRGKGLDVQGQRLVNWSSRIIEDKDFPQGQQHSCVVVLTKIMDHDFVAMHTQ